MFLYFLNASYEGEVSFLAKRVMQNISAAPQELTYLERTLSTLPNLQKESIVEEALMLVGERDYNIESMTRLIRTIRAEPESRRKKLNELVSINLKDHLPSVTDIVHTITALKGITLEESADIIRYLKELMESPQIEVESAQYDVGWFIKHFTKVNADHREKVIADMQVIASGRKGTLKEFGFLMREVAGITPIWRQYVIDISQDLATNREGVARMGSVKDLGFLVKRINTFVEHHDERPDILEAIFATKDDPNLTLSELVQQADELDATVFLPHSIMHVHTDNMHHVHREAYIYLHPIWQYLNEMLEKNKVHQLISFKTSLRLINRWVKHLDPEVTQALGGGHKNVQNLIRQLLQHDNWKVAMNSDFSYLKEGATGATLLQAVVTLCHKKHEFIPVFLLQGLYDSTTAFTDHQRVLVSVSCYRGMAERLLTCLREASPILDDIAKKIFEDESYQKIFEIEDASIEELQIYQEAQNVEEFKRLVQKSLQDLKPVLIGRLAQSYGQGLIERIFETDKIRKMFNMFDDANDNVSQAQLKGAFETMKG